MKKFFLLAAMVGVALTGCMKNEVYVPKCDTPISFEVANYVAQTRAAGEFDEDETFGVDAWSYDATAGTVQIMSNEVVSYDDVKNQWAPSKTYYWPINGTVDFIAYYPATATSKPTISYKYDGTDTITYSNYTVTDVDLMYADKAIRYSENVTAYGFEGVPTLFHHALAKINFKVQNAKPTDGIYSYDIKVNSIALKVYNQGSVILTNDGTTAASRGTWTLPTDNVWTPTDADAQPAATLTWTDDVTLSDNIAVAYADRTQYVLPQTLGASKQKITVNYTVTQYQTIGGTKTKISEETYDPTYDLYSAVLPRWEMNKNITYTISLSSIGTQILFAPAVEEWEPASGNVTIQ